MPIPFTRYVNITSGVGAGATVRRRELIARFYTTSAELPVNTTREFQSFDGVSAFFGSDTDESRRAAFYFGFVSKNTTRPQNVSFTRWVNTGSVTQTILGARLTSTLAQLQAITGGSFSITIGTSVASLTGLNFSPAADLAGVATILQTAIRAESGAEFTTATVAYNATRSRFEFTASGTTTTAISVTAGATNDAAGPIGWLTGAQLSAGAMAESITDLLRRSTEENNNFGSFAFVPTLTQTQVVEAATWNSTQNVLFQYHVAVLPADAQAYSQAIIALAGTGLTLMSTTAAGEFPEVLPMAVLAATNYQARNSVQNYMFQTGNLTPTVTTNADANLYDSLRFNYYGETQTAGQVRRFYQRGVLTGGDTNPTDMNTYANEQWLKDDAGVNIMNLLLALPRVPANQNGRGQLLSAVQTTVNQALLNGAISIGRTLSNTQRVFITEATGDPRAFQQVQTSGYWVNMQIEPFTTTDNRTEFRGTYRLIYARDDVVRMVQGSHTLI